MTDLNAARALAIRLLGKLEEEADHAIANVEEWGPGLNNQVLLWQEAADESQAFASALRAVLGLPPRTEKVG